MITNQHIEEGLSRACVQAIAAQAGLSLSVSELDYGIDGTFNEIRILNGRRFQIKLKQVSSSHDSSNI